MSKKSNSKKIKEAIQKIDLPSAVEIKIKFTEGNIDYIKSNNDSILFKTYLLSNLLHKTLNIGYTSELDFLNSKLRFEIIDAVISSDSKNDNNKNNFIVNQVTDIIIDNQNIQVDNLINDMEKKLNLNENEPQNIEELTDENKQLLKKIVEEKLGKNKINENIKYTPINYEDIYQKIVSLIDFHLKRNDKDTLDDKSSLLNKDKSLSYRHKGILLCGNSGIGKTHLFNCIKSNYILPNNITYFDIDIYKDLQTPDKSTSFIKSIFLFSKLLSPSIIFIENLDKIFPNNSNSDDNSSSNNNSENNPLLAELIIQMNEMPSNIMILSSCQMTSKVNPELTKLGFFDFNIVLPLPNFLQRKNLLEYILKDFNHNLQINEIENLADKSHGFVPGDFVKLFKEAYLHTELFEKNNNDNNSKENKIITKEIIDSCLGDIKPINLKDIIIDIPKVKWEEIGGNKEIINKIRQSIEWPLKNPKAFKRLGITPPNGTLLYGPPGCSKTLIAKALATESGLNFFAVKGPELFSKYVGDTEKAVRDVFKKARMSSPSIIFFDEIDAMATARNNESSGVEDKVLCQLLNEMDGIEGNGKVIIFGATNRPDMLDKALIRPGRFDRLIYIPPPDEKSREEIFKICFSKMKVDKDLNYNDLALKTPFFSGADIAKVSREAGMLAIADNINCEYIDKKFVLQSIESTKPIINKEMIDYFEKFSKKTIE